MSSTQFEGLDAIGIVRGGGAEPCHGPPESFTVVGLDIDAEKLLARFPETKGKVGEAHERARRLIKGVRDRTRTDANDPPPDWFVDTVGAAGIVQRIIVANLGKDAKGKPWCIVVAGRQRTVSARAWNAKCQPAQRIEMLAELRGFRHTDSINAELAALDLNSASNVFVPMRPSQMADHAEMHHEAGRAPIAIAAKIGARDADHVALLLCLAKCCPEVKKAVDDNRVPLRDALTLSALSPEEQARRVARKVAGPSKAAKNKAAAPRPKAIKRDVGLAMANVCEKRDLGSAPTVSLSDVAALVRYILGDREQVNGRKWLLDLAHEAEKAAKSKGESAPTADEAAE